MVCVFPIHEFCEEVNGGNYIVDTIYKDEDGEYIKADLREYDLILSESQFKLSKRRTADSSGILKALMNILRITERII